MFALFIIWVLGLVVGFALIHEALQTPINGPPHEERGFFTYSYLSGVTFFTLGYGDVTAASKFGRLLTVIEAGMGFGFMAVIIGYLPVLYQAFSRREVGISLLDARAGSPPRRGSAHAPNGPHGRAPRREGADGRMGTMGRRAVGKPSLFRGTEFLSFAARQPVVAGGADRRPGYVRSFAFRRPRLIFIRPA